MDLKEFHYELPESLIAAYPSRDRQASRLLVIRRDTGELIHSVFSELENFLDPGDVLVLNDTKVFPARLRGTKESGGKAEVLLLERFPGTRSLWIALIDAAKKPQVGSRIRFGQDLMAEVIGDMGRARFGLEFDHAGNFDQRLEALGEPPLPPYIRRVRDTASLDWDRYQTVYAANPGAIAAPTAGFHFTAQLLEKLQTKGIGRALLTLHVGPGTFQPVRDTRIEKHRMEGERYVLTAETAKKIHRTKESGHRVVAVGSTSTRALEWVARQKGKVEADEGIARLFIRPGDRFRVIDALITNFHLPNSTPLILVAAFAGIELVRRAYAEAIKMQYRFYSYGDAMLIL
ncbi:MAG TPA: tRNA preQ1(34) S-adenosylmethionine ribosyltransferase-isomerase QueA [Methylomirabilota bacterium]|nr:tRNA preQ1(34) S-adenosylmethionine ribosyltransferase-isomerase QueA [Methylomirabilota bacterium]